MWPTLPPPSSVTLWPLPSRVMLPVILRVLVSLISPLQAKVMTSPALSLLACATSACNWLSELQLVTVNVLRAWAGRTETPRARQSPASTSRPRQRSPHSRALRRSKQAGDTFMVSFLSGEETPQEERLPLCKDWSFHSRDDERAGVRQA